MAETLEEVQFLRTEMENLRNDLSKIQRQLGTKEDNKLTAKRRRQREFDTLGENIQTWAENLLKEDNGEDGWKEVLCNSLMRKKLNRDNTIQCYLKWMKDPREGDDDEKEYPCVKVLATLDAPLEDVCTYLAEESHVPEYNDFVIKVSSNGTE